MISRSVLYRKLFPITTLIILFICLTSCQNREKKTKQNKEIETNNTIVSKTQTKPVKIEPKEDTIQQNTTEQNTVQVATTTKTEVATGTKNVTPKAAKISANNKIYINLANLLNSIAVGETETKEQLIESKKVPEDALKIVKSVTKISKNELDIKWKSKWMVEKISDVKLTDGRVKVIFDKNKGLVYTSGKAIGIEYDDMVYTNLTIKGDRAYVPKVKKYSWKIGR